MKIARLNKKTIALEGSQPVHEASLRKDGYNVVGSKLDIVGLTPTSVFLLCWNLKRLGFVLVIGDQQSGY